MSVNEQATPRLKSIQRIALAMLVVAGVVNYIDRATLAVANPLIRNDLGLSIEFHGIQQADTPCPAANDRALKPS